MSQVPDIYFLFQKNTDICGMVGKFFLSHLIISTVLLTHGNLFLVLLFILTLLVTLFTISLTVLENTRKAESTDLSINWFQSKLFILLFDSSQSIFVIIFLFLSWNFVPASMIVLFVFSITYCM